eukprot:scaffold8374_cov175-Amphora_coffeaeformis.AAC.58
MVILRFSQRTLFLLGVFSSWKRLIAVVGPVDLATRRAKDSQSRILESRIVDPRPQFWSPIKRGRGEIGGESVVLGVE